MARSNRATGLHPLSYMGVEATTPAQLIEKNIDPEPSFFKFPVGTQWINFLTDDVWILTSIDGSVGTWTKMTGGQLTNITDAGNATAVDDDMNIIRVFNSLKMAAIAVGVSITKISMCCSGERLTAGNYIWKYKKDCEDLL